MEHSSAPLEGIVVIVVETPEGAARIEKALSQQGAAVFVADGDDSCREILGRVSPHFAVIDPTVSGGSGPQSLAWTLFSHPECRTVVYSSNVHPPAHVELKWLISKDRPVTDVVDAIASAVKDSNWIAKGGDDVKPTV